ncbi:MAG: Uncharacterised protein [Acidimicrobiales bacterium AG-410-I20]|nr:MAG: Uncharacterised protein [Acidimicrobiales bacterium AG-410-I20]
MKKVTKSIAAIAVIFGSFIVGGNAALAISLPPTPIDPVVIPEGDGPEFSGPGSFDISMTAELDTHCDEDDGIVTITIENNLSSTGIIPPNRWVAVHMEASSESEGDNAGWLGFGFLSYPVFFELEKGDGGPAEFEVPSGDFELTTTIYVSAKEIDQTVDVDGVDGPDKAADFVADNDPSFQKTVSVECSSDDPVETTEDTPEEVTEDTPEEVTEDTPEETEVDDPIEGSPLFTG